MIKAILLSFVGMTYSFEITITNQFIYQEYQGLNENSYTIYDLNASKTHVIQGDKKIRTISNTEWHKDNWVLESKSLVNQNVEKNLIYLGCDCKLLKEDWEVNIPKLDSVQIIHYSYHCNLSSLCEYLDLDPTSLNVLPQFKNLIETHPFEVARWTMYPTGKFHISPPLEKIEFTEIKDYDFIAELLEIDTLKSE